MILKPREENILQADCYADADFADLWKSEDNKDPHCVK
jgi:hypothetical protein